MQYSRWVIIHGGVYTKTRHYIPTHRLLTKDSRTDCPAYEGMQLPRNHRVLTSVLLTVRPLARVRRQQSGQVRFQIVQNLQFSTVQYRVK